MALRLTERTGVVRVEVRVAPRASREAILGEHDGALKVALTAAPVDGAANEALVALLASALGVPKKAVVLVSGQTRKQKVLDVSGVSAATIRALALPTRDR
jgi:uncharacterized protein